MSATIPNVVLRTGAAIPSVGLGVFQSPRGQVTYDAVRAALDAGYRHVDTASLYGNESDVGRAILDSGVPRSEVFVTTKLWNGDHGYDRAMRAFDGSYKRLGLEQIDLYLIHWPVERLRGESWRALERLHAEGRVRSIGVSNYVERHLRELLDECETPPHVNQIEVHPFLQRREVRALCAQAGIVVEAYSPLTRGMRLKHPVVVEVARRLARTPAQVLLRWGIESGLVVLPKSTHAERIRENAALFDFALGDEERARLDALDEGLATGWNPDDAP